VAVTAAVMITVISALATYVFFILPGSDEIPTAAIIISIVASFVQLVGAWSLWQLRRWGAILTFVLALLSVLSSAPAFIEAPSGWIVVGAAVGIPLSIAVMVLVALRSSRRAYR